MTVRQDALVIDIELPAKATTRDSTAKTGRRNALRLGLVASLLALCGRGAARAADALVIEPGGVKIEQEAWKVVSSGEFKNGWVNWKDSTEGYGPAGYFRDSLGIVHLRGVVQDGTVGWGTGVIFTLPAGYQPEYRSVHTVMSYPGEFGQLEVAANGDVVAAFPDPFPERKMRSFSLDGVTFRAAR